MVLAAITGNAIIVHTGGIRTTSATASGTGLIIPAGDTGMIITGRIPIAGTIDNRPGQANGGDIAARGICIPGQAGGMTVRKYRGCELALRKWR